MQGLRGRCPLGNRIDSLVVILGTTSACTAHMYLIALVKLDVLESVFT